MNNTVFDTNDLNFTDARELITYDTDRLLSVYTPEEVRLWIIELRVLLESANLQAKIDQNARFGRSAEQIVLPKDEKQISAEEKQECDKSSATEEEIKSIVEISVNELEKESKSSAKPRKAKKFDHVERRVVEHRIPEGEVCPICGKKLQHISFKSKIRAIYHPARIEIIEDKYETASCPCKCMDEHEKAIIRTVAPQEPDLIPKSFATESLVAGIVDEKFSMGTPLYRLEKHFRDNGFSLSRQTMSNQTEYCYFHYLQPVWFYLLRELRNQSVVHMDETFLKCLKDEHKQSCVVVGVSGEHAEKQIAVYRFFPGKAQSFVTEMLGENFQGALMTDGLRAYANYNSGLKLNCMAHARRRMYEAITAREDYKEYAKLEETAPEKMAEFLRTHGSLEIQLRSLTLMRNLYQLEKEYCEQGPVALHRARQKQGRPTFERLSFVMREINDGFYDGSAAQKAARYFLDREDSLSNYLEDGTYPIDNNEAERTVKSFVIARKNFLFANTVSGAETAAGYLTLMETARRNGLNPRKYIEYLLSVLKYYEKDEINDDLIAKLLPYSPELPEELKIKR